MTISSAGAKEKFIAQANYLGEPMGALVLRGGFANKIKSEDVNRAQEKIMKDRL